MGGHGHGAMEVAKTVLEVADVAMTAVERCHHLHGHHEDDKSVDDQKTEDNCREKLESLKSENRRLRNLLGQNLKLLQNLAESPCLRTDCSPDLYARLVATVGSEEFLTRLKSLHQESVDGTGNRFPFKEATEEDVGLAGILVDIDREEPSWWVWVTDEMAPSKAEEWSGIDDENYVVVSEEHVVDGVANFMAKCVLSNSKAKNLAPEELQKTLSEALGCGSKLEKILNIWHAGERFYCLSKWGLVMTGLYKSRAVLKVAAKGVYMTSKVALRAI